MSDSAPVPGPAPQRWPGRAWRRAALALVVALAVAALGRHLAGPSVRDPAWRLVPAGATVLGSVDAAALAALPAAKPHLDDLKALPAYPAFAQAGLSVENVSRLYLAMDLSKVGVGGTAEALVLVRGRKPFDVQAMARGLQQASPDAAVSADAGGVIGFRFPSDGPAWRAAVVGDGLLAVGTPDILGRARALAAGSGRAVASGRGLMSLARGGDRGGGARAPALASQEERQRLLRVAPRTLALSPERIESADVSLEPEGQSLSLDVHAICVSEPAAFGAKGVFTQMVMSVLRPILGQDAEKADANRSDRKLYVRARLAGPAIQRLAAEVRRQLVLAALPEDRRRRVDTQLALDARLRDLADENVYKRYYAAMFFAEPGRDFGDRKAEVVKALTGLLRDQEGYVAAGVARALRQIAPDVGETAFNRTSERTHFYGIRGAHCLAAGAVYFLNAADALSAMDLATGRLKWTWKPPALPGTKPPFAGDGVVGVFAHGNRVFVLDAETGRPKWEHAGVFSSRDDTLAAAGVVCFVEAGGYNALDRDTGRPLWKLAAAGRGAASTPLLNGGAALLAPAGAGLRAVDWRSGRELWRDDEADVLGAVSSDGRLHAASRRALYALDPASGRRLWRWEPAPAVAVSTPAADPAAAYVACRQDASDPFVAAVRDGKTAWRVGLEGSGPAQVSLAAASGLVVACAGTRAVALAADTGREAWRIEAADSLAGAFALAEGLLLYVDADLLRAVDIKTGKERWTFPADRSRFAPTAAGGRVYHRLEQALVEIEAATGREAAPGR